MKRNRQGLVGIGGLAAPVLSFATAFMGLMFLSGCNSSNFNAPAETVAATSGSPQSAPVNTAFTAPLVATVTMGGSPVSGAFVTFTAPATGASGTFASTLSSTETDTTNASGVATSSTFTANGMLGADVVTASVAGATASANFNLTNASGPPASIAATSGSLQDTIISTAFGAPLAATVSDSNGYPVSGASVTFTAPATGASGTFGNSTTTETDTTNASGVATSSTFTANGTVGSYTVTASVAGVATAADFSLANVTGGLESITATSGTPQSASVNAAFAAPLVVTVLDGNQNPVDGAVVTFMAPATGAGGTFAGGVNTVATNASGVATSPVFTANGAVGTYTVTASVALGAEPANFVLTNTPITYTFYLNGLSTLDEYRDVPNYYALAGAVTMDGNGDVLGGEQDYNDGFGLTSPQPSGDTILAASGALTWVDAATGQATLTLTTNNTNLGNNGVETLGVQFVNSNHALVIQFDGTATSSGSMDTQTLSSALNDANYAFALSGVDSSYLPVVYGGVFSISASGTALQGSFDVNDDGSVTLGTPFTGTISGPDSFGRGTITASSALPVTLLNYYVVGPEALRIIDVDNANSSTGVEDSALGSAFGQGTGSFSNASLGSSVFGVESNSLGSKYAALGEFSTTPGSGVSSTFSGVADDNEFDNGVLVTEAAISGTYAVASNGYGSLTIAAGDLGDVSALGIYMTDPTLNLNDPNNTTSGLGGALVSDLDANVYGIGTITPQTDTSTGSFAGSYGFGGQAYNVLNGNLFGWEFDFVGQGMVKNLALSKAVGLVSDPFFAFGGNPTGSGAKFQGIATPDGTYAGRYTIRVGITVPSETPEYFETVIYQASGGQLFWLDEDPNGESVFFGPIEQQGSLTGLVTSQKGAAKAQAK